jgi:hypothetical protein
MIDLQMLGTPGHLVSGGIELWSVAGNERRFGHVAPKPRRTYAFTGMATDLCRSVRERSP